MVNRTHTVVSKRREVFHLCFTLSSETGSDTVNADLDEQQSLRNSNNNSSSGGLIGTGLNMPSYEELPPIYVIKNLVVKPVRCICTHISWLVFQTFGFLSPRVVIMCLYPSKNKKFFFMNPDNRPIQSPDAAFVSVDSMIRFHQTYCDLTLKSFNNGTLC